MLRPFLQTPPPGWPFNELERTLKLAARDPSARVGFWKLLLEEKLFAIGEVEGTESRGGKFVAHEGQQMALAGITLENGPAVAVFTSLPLLRCSLTEERRYVGVRGRELLEVLRGQRVALNPCGPCGKELTPEEVASALGGIIMTGDRRMVVAEETQVFLGQLAQQPEDLIEELRRVCARCTGVRAAYSSGVLMPASGETLPHPLIGIDAEDAGSVIRACGEASDAWSRRTGMPVDFVDLRDSDGMTDHLRSSGRRFFDGRGWLSRLLGRG